MPTPARVVVLPQQPGPLEIMHLDLPNPGPHQVVVKQYASGVCHSQLHQMHNPRANAVVLGHESTGIVLDVGSAVEHVAVDDMVMVTARFAVGADADDAATRISERIAANSCRPPLRWARDSGPPDWAELRKATRPTRN